MILTTDRILALEQISRWGGWVCYPWSVLEHTIAGVMFLQSKHATPMQIRAWLLHDVEESEFMGDVPSPHKERYCNELYRVDVTEFVSQLAAETGTLGVTGQLVKEVDEIMLRAEYATISKKVDPAPRMDDDIVLAMSFIRQLIESPGSRAQMFWQLWVYNDPYKNKGN